MTDQTNTSRRGFGFAALIVAGLVGLVGGGLASAAVGHGVMGGGFRHFGGMHYRGGHHGPMDPARAKEHAEHMVGHLAWAIDATAEQKKQLTVIATAMVNDLIPAHQKMHAAKGRIVALLRAPKTDRAALEALRAEHLALADDVSKRLAQGLADAADVLTPQQREKLAAHWSF
jgi:Spy/CpxP family protein refolding chaperone